MPSPLNTGSAPDIAGGKITKAAENTVARSQLTPSIEGLIEAAEYEADRLAAVGRRAC
jgi:hypothetical protein